MTERNEELYIAAEAVTRVYKDGLFRHLYGQRVHVTWPRPRWEEISVQNPAYADDIFRLWQVIDLAEVRRDTELRPQAEEFRCSYFSHLESLTGQFLLADILNARVEAELGGVQPPSVVSQVHAMFIELGFEDGLWRGCRAEGIPPGGLTSRKIVEKVLDGSLKLAVPVPSTNVDLEFNQALDYYH